MVDHLLSCVETIYPAVKSNNKEKQEDREEEGEEPNEEDRQKM